MLVYQMGTIKNHGWKSPNSLYKNRAEKLAAEMQARFLFLALWATWCRLNTFQNGFKMLRPGLAEDNDLPSGNLT